MRDLPHSQIKQNRQQTPLYLGTLRLPGGIQIWQAEAGNGIGFPALLQVDWIQILLRTVVLALSSPLVLVGPHCYLKITTHLLSKVCHIYNADQTGSLE